VTSGRPPVHDDAFWRDYLTRGHPTERAARRFFIRIPHEPRCSVCAAPFAGIGGPVMRLIGKRQSDKSPKICDSCYTFLSRHHGGAEIECTMLFADIRGSTALAEAMSSAQYSILLDRFYAAASHVVFDHDGAVDKFVGDELVAFFYPLLTGDGHAAKGVEAARALLVATGHQDADGPWVPVGAGVHSGLVWMGAIGDGTHVELTAVGDAVNVAARLASAAAAGEVLVTVDAATAAGLDPGLAHRSIELKGKQLPTEVISLSVGAGSNE
jgi:adenylate cyclase